MTKWALSNTTYRNFVLVKKWVAALRSGILAESLNERGGRLSSRLLVHQAGSKRQDIAEVHGKKRYLKDMAKL